MSEHTQSTAVDGEQATPDGLKIWSCVNCRRRKLRCERYHPCPNCVRSKIDCHFPVTGRVPRRSRQPATAISSSQRQSELLGRLRRLEAVVTELTGQMEDGTVGSSSATPSDTSALWQKHNDPMEDFGSLVIDADGSLRVAKGFWSIFCTEVDNIFQAVADAADAAPAGEPATSDEGSNVEGSIRSHHQRFVFDSTLDAGAYDDASLLPLPSQMLFLWQIFCENVDPFINILDIADTTKKIHTMKGSFTTLSLEDQCLLVSISLAAVISMDEEEVRLNFGQLKPQLLARLRLGTENALANAKFMTARSIVVAQAFTIYNTILPQLGAMQLAAPMTAILVRVALSMGLHQDPGTNKKGTTSFSTAEIETRRRLWWHICFLDARVRHKDVPELSISPKTATTQEPANVEDSIRGSHGFSHVSLCRIRCDLWRLSHDFGGIAKDDFESQKQLLSEARTRLTRAHFDSQDVSEHSLQSFTYHLTRLFFSQVDYTIHRRQARTAEQAANTLAAAETLMETTFTLNTRPQWKMWRWQLQGYAPWSAMLSTLHLLSRGPWSSQAHRAWSALLRLVEVLPREAHDLRVLQVIIRCIEDIRKAGQQLGASNNVAEEDQHAASDQGSVSAKLQNQPQISTHNLECPKGFSVDDSPVTLSGLQESWDLPDIGEDTIFQWEALLGTEDAMNQQVLDDGSDMSIYWGQLF